jgi:DNA repair photolyase
MIYEEYETKHILNTHKHVDGGWFWNKYSAFPYLGCEWGCTYCYQRDEKYNPYRLDHSEKLIEDPFSEYIKIKKGAHKLLRRALKDKPIDIIYLDNYQPVDAKYKYVREMLKVCNDLGFPVFINEKSPMLLRDIDILKDIYKESYLNVGWSIITSLDDDTRLFFEAKAPSVEERFKAMRRLSIEGIFTGTVMMPLLPFIYDNEENIRETVRMTRDNGGKYVLDGGLTLGGYCGEYFYKSLLKYDRDVFNRYKELYGEKDKVSNRLSEAHKLVKEYCEKFGIKNNIPRPISHYPENLRFNKIIAEDFYHKAREISISGKHSYREWAYRKAAWSLDELSRNIEEIYQEEGQEGL